MARAPAPVSGSAARAVRACGRLRAVGAEGSGGNQPAAAAGGWDRWAYGAALQPLRPPNPIMHRVFPRGRPHRRGGGGGSESLGTRSLINAHPRNLLRDWS